MSAAETWRLNAGDETRVMDGQNNPICDVKCGGMSGRTVAQGEKIARLIAAAPALLEALDRLTQWEGHHVYCGHGNDDSRPCVCGFNAAYDAARAASSLAKGESA